MPITGVVSGRSKPLDIASYSVTEDATPLAPGDSAGGVGRISLSARAIITGALQERTATLVGHTVTLTDSQSQSETPFMGRGSISGKITSCSQPGERASFEADSLLSRLNVERTATPFFGTKRTDALTTTVVNEVINPSVEVDNVGWNRDAGATGAAALTRDNAAAGSSGAYRNKEAWTTSATTIGGIYYSGTAVSAGNWYNISAYASASKSQAIRLAILWLDSVGGTVGSGAIWPGPSTIVGSGSWTRVSAALLAPVGAASVRVHVYNYNDGLAGNGFSQWLAGDYLLVDAMQITQGIDLWNYFDGSSSGATWTGTAHASRSQQVQSIARNTGYNATIGSAFRYYCGLVGIPSTGIVVDGIFDTIPVAYPGWTGNVWDYIKQLCSAVGAEVVMQNDLVVFRQPRRHVVPIDSSMRFTQSVSQQTSATSIDIVNQNNKWLGAGIAFTATSVYKVESGESTQIEVKTTASLATVNSPICVASIAPRPYLGGSGQYVITDANNLTVDPVWWRARGGNVTVSLGSTDPQALIMIIQGAVEDATYKAPFRLIEIVSGVDTPSLYVTGEGVFSDPVTINIPTGAASSATSKQTAATINNIFISDASQAMDRGVLSAQQAAGPLVTISGSIAYDPAANGQEFGVVVGSRIRVYNGIYRITSATYTPSSITISAVLDMTFDDLVDLFAVTFDEFNATYAGLTFNQFNALWLSTVTFDAFNAQTSAPTFDSFNTLFADMTFDDYAVFPYTKEAPKTDAESKL